MRGPEVAAPSILFAEPGHPANRTCDSSLNHPEEILLVFQVTNEHTRLDPNEWFSIQSAHECWDVKLVQLRELPRPQFVVAVVAGPVMSRAQRDRGRIG
jgi:hypothetical protein